MCGSVGTVSLFFHCAQREKHSYAPKTDVLKFSKYAERAKKTSELLQFRGFLNWNITTSRIFIQDFQITFDLHFFWFLYYLR